jgi:hypothetical protein
MILHRKDAFNVLYYQETETEIFENPTKWVFKIVVGIENTTVRR